MNRAGQGSAASPKGRCAYLHFPFHRTTSITHFFSPGLSETAWCLWHAFEVRPVSVGCCRQSRDIQGVLVLLFHITCGRNFAGRLCLSCCAIKVTLSEINQDLTEEMLLLIQLTHHSC